MASELLNEKFIPSLGYNYIPTSFAQYAVINDILSPFQLSKDKVIKFWDCLSEEIEKGLEGDPQNPSCLQMENSFVTNLPTGQESGEYLAIDLGGTNFRVIKLTLDKGVISNEDVEYFEVPENLRSSDASQLFDFIADSVRQFAQTHSISNRKMSLGFTFSFPVQQESLDKAILLSWAMTFTCPGAVGKDAAQLLRDALIRRGCPNIDVVGILNDSTGCMVYGSFLRPNCVVGTILGSGTNGCYKEKISSLKKWTNPPSNKAEVLINTEWGQFGDNGCLDFLRTDIDDRVDLESCHPGKFMIERYTGGNFIGDIVRRIMTKAISLGALFGGKLPKKLEDVNSIMGAFVSSVESDSIDDTTNRTRQLLTSLSHDVTEGDICVVKQICYVVSERSALIIATILSCFLKRIGQNDVSVAFDGSLYKHHPRMREMIRHFVQAIIPELKFELFLADDGCGKGGALVAAIAAKQQ